MSDRMQPDLRCYYHPDVEATGQCDRCGDYLCAECQVSFEGQYLCRQCCRHAASIARCKLFPRWLMWLQLLALILFIVSMFLPMSVERGEWIGYWVPRGYQFCGMVGIVSIIAALGILNSPSMLLVSIYLLFMSISPLLVIASVPFWRSMKRKIVFALCCCLTLSMAAHVFCLLDALTMSEDTTVVDKIASDPEPELLVGYFILMPALCLYTACMWKRYLIIRRCSRNAAHDEPKEE